MTIQSDKSLLEDEKCDYFTDEEKEILKGI
jgi:hypothetical protein